MAMSEIEDPKLFEIIARLLRAKRVKWNEWKTILENDTFKEFGQDELFDALSAPCEYAVEPREFKQHMYYLKIGGEKFLIIYDSTTDKINLYAILAGQRLDQAKPLLSFSREFLFDLIGELPNAGNTK